MPNAATYRVVLELATTGQLGTKVGELGAKAALADTGLSRLGEAGKRMGEMVVGAAEKMGGALERAADRALELAKHIGEVGLAAGIAAAAYGVGHLNQELENTQISLAAIFQAQGFTKDFEGGFVMARDQLAKMKQDVKTLPGDLGQLSDIMKMIATPAAQGGATPDQIRKLAGRTMLTSTILGVPLEVAQREMAGLLSGRAGAHNIFGARLGLIGDEAEKFNKMGPAERLARVNAELDKYQGAADRFGQSFTAQWTTLKDNIKYTLLAPATGGIFDRAKHSIAELNTYFDEHKQQIESVVSLVNRRLVSAWDKIEEIVKRIAPIVGGMLDKLLAMQPSEMGKHLLGGAAGIAALKVGGMGLSGMASGARLAGALGGGEALAAIGGTALPALAVAAAAAIPALMAAAGAADILTDKNSIYHDEAVSLAEDLGSTWGRVGDNLQRALEPAERASRRLLDQMGILALEGLDRASLYAEKVSIMLVDLSSGFQSFIDALKYGMGQIDALKKFREIQPEETERPTIDKHIDDIVAGALAQDRTLRTTGAITPATPKPGAGGGGGGTHIAKVEIVVTGNNDPSRVARLTLAELRKLANNPTSSNYVPNFQQSKHAGM